MCIRDRCIYGVYKGLKSLVLLSTPLLVTALIVHVEDLNLAVMLLTGLLMFIEAAYLASNSRRVMLAGSFFKWRLLEITTILATSLIVSISVLAIARPFSAFGFEFIEIAVLAVLLVYLARQILVSVLKA